jgi:hypothetical protein
MRTRVFGMIVAAVAFLDAGAGGARADFVTLYDGSKGTTPDAQGFLYLTNPLVGASATQTASGGVTVLDTTPKASESAGYFSTGNPLVGTLDRSSGFTVTFRLQLQSESHASNDRAGFSIIALGSDSKGVELGFWSNQVWAQHDSPLFTHGEGAAFDTTAALTTYALTVQGNTYSLTADGAQVLSGAVRDYSAFGAPYTSKNFLFFGDDTSSASARTSIASVTLTTVPEPSSAVLVGIACLTGLGLARPRRVPDAA